jgi:hypothetical protein
MSTSANKPIEDIEASLLAATKWALDELLRQAHATMAAKAGGDLDIVLARIGARWKGRRDGGGGVRRSVCVGSGCLSHCLIGEKPS